MALLELKNIKKYFSVEKGFFKKEMVKIKAVDGVSLQINKKEIFGLVGESGCGKSTLARIITKIISAGEGSIIFNGRDITNVNSKQMLPFRNKIQLVFQDPYSSLDPLFSIYSILKEALDMQKSCKNKNECIREMHKTLEKVGLSADSIKRLPHQFSGGQRQRIAIARALITKPEFLILDEPVSSLDVLSQMQILKLLKELQINLSLSYLFISHNLRVIQKISDRTAVMYLGKIVELSPTAEIFRQPLHPYTHALMQSSFFKEVISAEPVVNADDLKGCAFYNRCQHKKSHCREEPPELIKHSENHFVACHFPLNRV